MYPIRQEEQGLNWTHQLELKQNGQDVATLLQEF